MCTSCIVISIITGIICDTFGELRVAQDEAKAYRGANNFITGLPYSSIPQEKSTWYMQYSYLLLYLVKKADSMQEMAPLEEFIWNEVNHGSVEWLPQERCFTLGHQTTHGAAVEREVRQIKSTLSDVDGRMAKMEANLEALIAVSQPSSGQLDSGPGTPTTKRLKRQLNLMAQ
jgi:hypothetical protein